MSDAKDADATSDPGPARREGMEFLRFIAGAAAVYLLITTVFFRVFFIPSSSMEPTLEVKDRVIVLNFAYGWSRHSLPFGMGGLLPESDGRLLGRMPERGDVVVFRRPQGGRDHLIKRVVGLPGDTVAMRAGRLYVNDALVPQAFVERYAYRNHRGGIERVDRIIESLPDGPEHVVYNNLAGATPADTVGPFFVQPGHLFVMGDNRDSSSDSRASALADPNALGQIPLEFLVGRAVTVLFTFKSCRQEQDLWCPSGRVWRPL